MYDLLIKNGRITSNLSQSELKQSLRALLDVGRIPGYVPRRMRGWIGGGK